MPYHFTLTSSSVPYIIHLIDELDFFFYRITMLLKCYDHQCRKVFYYYYTLDHPHWGQFKILMGGKGVTSAWSPLGNFLEGQAHPNLSSNQVFLFFLTGGFLCLLSGGTDIVMFIFEYFLVQILYIFSIYSYLYILYIFSLYLWCLTVLSRIMIALSC